MSGELILIGINSLLMSVISIILAYRPESIEGLKRDEEDKFKAKSKTLHTNTC